MRRRSKIVGGVTPGKGGRDVYGVPVYDTVREITQKVRVDGTVITVPWAFTADAAYEAIDAGIKLLVIITEGVPRKDATQIVEYANRHGARLIGPNCLGVIAPDVCRFGSLGGPAVDCRKAFKPGVVGVMSRSGGMTTEICNALTAAGSARAPRFGRGAPVSARLPDLMPRSGRPGHKACHFSETGAPGSRAALGRRRTRAGFQCRLVRARL